MGIRDSANGLPLREVNVEVTVGRQQVLKSYAQILSLPDTLTVSYTHLDVYKRQDWGKDHYATVTWSDAPDNRRIAIAWMSNWQYANDVPTSQYRSPNSVPRDLSLFTVDGETYLQSAPSPELLKLRDISKKRSFKVNGTRTIKDMIAGNEGAYEIELTICLLYTSRCV